MLAIDIAFVAYQETIASYVVRPKNSGTRPMSAYPCMHTVANLFLKSVSLVNVYTINDRISQICIQICLSTILE